MLELGAHAQRAELSCRNVYSTDYIPTVDRIKLKFIAISCVTAQRCIPYRAHTKRSCCGVFRCLAYLSSLTYGYNLSDPGGALCHWYIIKDRTPIHTLYLPPRIILPVHVHEVHRAVHLPPLSRILRISLFPGPDRDHHSKSTSLVPSPGSERACDRAADFFPKIHDDP